jgi:Raf kinase inhibitor-like YbhB/YbcL family protein
MRRATLCVLLCVLTACAAPAAPRDQVEEALMTLSITSSAFAQGEKIPAVYSCDGKGISPPLAWTGAPAGTKSFGLIMDDPDAPMGTFVHWVIYNLPGSTSGLPEAVAKDAALADGTRQGPNSMRRPGYIPPCPPGGTHRYYFKLYALDTVLDLESAAKDELLKAMQGHILAEGELMCTFSR